MPRWIHNINSAEAEAEDKWSQITCTTCCLIKSFAVHGNLSLSDTLHVLLWHQLPIRDAGRASLLWVSHSSQCFHTSHTKAEHKGSVHTHWACKTSHSGLTESRRWLLWLGSTRRAPAAVLGGFSFARRLGVHPRGNPSEEDLLKRSRWCSGRVSAEWRRNGDVGVGKTQGWCGLAAAWLSASSPGHTWETNTDLSASFYFHLTLIQTGLAFHREMGVMWSAYLGAFSHFKYLTPSIPSLKKSMRTYSSNP